jgi:hypothetical protein
MEKVCQRQTRCNNLPFLLKVQVIQAGTLLRLCWWGDNFLRSYNGNLWLIWHNGSGLTGWCAATGGITTALVSCGQDIDATCPQGHVGFLAQGFSLDTELGLHYCFSRERNMVSSNL